MPVDPKFLVDLRGKQYVLFSGLLDLAHQGGLIAIETEVVENLSRPAEDAWVVRATGRFRSADGEAVWSAPGTPAPRRAK